MSRSIKEWNVYDAPVAIIDLETTGLYPGSDRVIEFSIVHIDPGCKPKLVFDTLINPGRPVSATQIHGITDEDVEDAPEFREISGQIIRLLYNRVVAAYNVYFDINFLKYEFSRLGISMVPPHCCLMYMGSLVGLNSRKNLSEVCKYFNIPASDLHVSGHDALAASQLWYCYLDLFSKRGIKKFGDLVKIKTYKFMESFDYPPFMPPLGANLPSSRKTKSRLCNSINNTGQTFNTTQALASKTHPITFAEDVKPEKSRQERINDYYECLKIIISDLTITDEEIEFLRQKQIESGLTKSEIMSLHSFIFGSVLLEFSSDHFIDESERATLAELYTCLKKLGWAPGE